MRQNVPSRLSVSDYRRNALRRFSNIVRRGAHMSSVDHGVLLLLMFEAEDKTAKVCPTVEHRTNDPAGLGGI
jgi:hypothetical protein